MPRMPSHQMSAAGGGLLLAALTALLCRPAPLLATTRPAPPISAERWLNTPPLRIADLRGRVVLVEFWTFACWNCRNVEPAVKRWHATYAARGLTVIGVHTPELERERDPANVAAYVREHGITYPIAIDNAFATWERYGNRAWPALYLIDRAGQIRYVRIGEGAYEETERQIRTLLAE